MHLPVPAVSSLSRERGFTLLELLSVILISSLVVGSAMPVSSALYDSFNKRSAEVQVLEDLRRAQATAVEQGCQGILTFSEDNRVYTFGCDYVPYSEADPPVWDSSLFVRRLPSRISMSADDLIIFNTRGQVVSTEGDLDTRTISLMVYEDGHVVTFATGTLRPTGFFNFN